MRALIVITVVAAIVTLGEMLPHLSMLPDTGFHPRLVVTLVFSL